MAMVSGVRSISKLKHVSTEALLLLSSYLSHTTMKMTFLDKPLQKAAEGNLYCQNSRGYNFSLRDGRKSELWMRQWRSYYGDVDYDLDVDGLADEQITFPEFDAKGELLIWEKAKFIAGSALPDHSPSIGYLNVWEGSGELFAVKGDKIRVQYKCYDRSCHIDNEKLPHDMLLGQGRHGQGLDEGIYGMRSGGRRRIAILQMLCATSNHKLLKKFYVRANTAQVPSDISDVEDFWNHPEEYKIFDVILIDIDKGI